MKMKVACLAGLLAITGSFSTWAEKEPSEPVPDEKPEIVAEIAAADILKSSVNNLADYLRSHPQADVNMILAYLEQYVTPHIDFVYMTKWIIGKNFKAMDPFQRAQAVMQMKNLILTTLAQQLTFFSQQRFEFAQAKFKNDHEVLLSMKITNAEGYPTKVNFRFYKSNKGWKLFDVLANKSSILVYYRNKLGRM